MDTVSRIHHQSRACNNLAHMMNTDDPELAKFFDQEAAFCATECDVLEVEVNKAWEGCKYINR